MEQALEVKKQEIQKLGLDKIKSYFELDVKMLADLDAESIKHLFNMAKIGMQFEKEMNVAKRATEMNFIRVGRLVTENKEELKKYIKRSLPQYY
jgi:type II secretory pathway component HofQ